MRKFTFETSKNTLPTASIFTRASLVATVGIVTASEPSFGVLAASTCGYVRPPSVDRLIFTSVVLTGARSVFALSQVIVCVEPPGYVTAVFGAVTRNGPAFGGERQRQVGRAVAAAAHPQVARGEAEVQRRRGPRFTPVKPR